MVNVTLPEYIRIVKGDHGIYRVNLQNVTCTCQGFVRWKEKLDITDSKRMCKHLKPFETEISKYLKKKGWSMKSRHPREKIERLKTSIFSFLDDFDFITRREICGSYRRGLQTIGDIDILLTVTGNNFLLGPKIFKEFENIVQKTLVMGSQKASFLMEDVQVDIRVLHDKTWVFALMHNTGSKYENLRMRYIAKNNGYRLNEYGLTRLSTGETIPLTTEEEVYNFLGEIYKKPEERI